MNKVKGTGVTYIQYPSNGSIVLDFNVHIPILVRIGGAPVIFLNDKGVFEDSDPTKWIVYSIMADPLLSLSGFKVKYFETHEKAAVYAVKSYLNYLKFKIKFINKVQFITRNFRLWKY